MVSQVVVERQALVIVCVHGHLGEEGWRGEQLHFDAEIRYGIAGCRDMCTGQGEREDGEERTAHCSARIQVEGAITGLFVVEPAVGCLNEVGLR